MHGACECVRVCASVRVCALRECIPSQCGQVMIIDNHEIVKVNEPIEAPNPHYGNLFEKGVYEKCAYLYSKEFSLNKTKHSDAYEFAIAHARAHKKTQHLKGGRGGTYR